MGFRETLSIVKSSFKAKGNINVSTTSTSTTINHYGDQTSSAPDPTTLLLQKHVTFRAFYDSKNRFDPPKCHPETRTAVLKTVDSWARNSSTESMPIMWLNGAAGAGKSAIAQTSMERWTKDKLTAVGFFFWRTDDQRNQKSYLVPTLAYQLMKMLPAATNKFKEAIGDGDIFQRTLESQVESLIVNPLKSLLAKESKTVIIVIDGLDECCVDLPKTDDFPGQDHESQQAEILKVLALACQHIPSLRILIACRPDHRIRLSFESQSFVGGFLKERSAALSLNEVDTDDDILLFLKCNFMDIRAEYRGIPSSWPSSEQLSQLVINSSGCFIYPSVVVRYILHRRKRPEESLETILDLHPNTEKRQDNPFAELDALYQHIMRSVPADSIGVVRDVLGYLCFQIGNPYRFWIRPIFVDSTPLESPLFFQQLLFLAPGEIFDHLTDLHAILHIPDPNHHGQEDQNITFLHATFSQYLTDESRSGEFFISREENRHRYLGLYEQHIQRAFLQTCKADASNRAVSEPNNIYCFPNLVQAYIELSEKGKMTHEPGKDGLIILWIVFGHFIKWRPACCKMGVHGSILHGALNGYKLRRSLNYLDSHLGRMELPPEELVVAQHRLQEAIQHIQEQENEFNTLYDSEGSGRSYDSSSVKYGDSVADIEYRDAADGIS